MRLNRSRLLAALLASLALSAHADEWKDLASDQGVKLEAQAVGNIARLRFTNTRKDVAQVNWNVETALATKQKIARQGELRLDAGESQILTSGPYHDAAGPQAIRTIQGKLSVMPAAK